MIISNLHARYLTILLLLCGGTVIAGCNSDQRQAVTTKKKQAAAHVVATTPARMQSVRNQLTTSGTIEAGLYVRLYNEVSARIRYLPYHEGDAVSAGTLVIGGLASLSMHSHDLGVIDDGNGKATRRSLNAIDAGW